jgi:hypothetical protein
MTSCLHSHLLSVGNNTNRGNLLDNHRAREDMDTNQVGSVLQTQANSPMPPLYHRSTSHILTTPPNPLAINGHIDPEFSIEQSLNKCFSPLRSAGFQLSANGSTMTTLNDSMHPTSFFTFDENVMDRSKTNHEICGRSLKISTNLMHDDNSNLSSSKSSSQKSMGPMFSQSPQTPGKRRRKNRLVHCLRSPSS